MINGTENNKAQKVEILPKFLCQKCSFIKGNTAMDNKSPIKGIT